MMGRLSDRLTVAIRLSCLEKLPEIKSGRRRANYWPAAGDGNNWNMSKRIFQPNSVFTR